MRVRVAEKEWELERDASPRDACLWCFPNQGSGTSSDEDVMSLSGFLSKSTSCFKMLFYFFHIPHFLFVCFHVSICLCVCPGASLHMSALLLSLFIYCFSSCYAAGEWAFAALFFMNGSCCLLSDKAISVSSDDEHIQCDHTNFLFVYSPASDWLSLSSQWQRFWGWECVFLVVHAYAHVGQSVEGSLWASFLVITDKNILFPRERQSSFCFFFFFFQMMSAQPTL